ncbi:hypothetical protein Sjap_011523 [Stephania japonica]|uniref:Uncharacterized protein n=1 Tax=Stephania japonica TaxID=461633 RepID=A0AAP0P859_9MAGN
MMRRYNKLRRESALDAGCSSSDTLNSEQISKGRGPALAIDDWGTGYIMNVEFDEYWKPIGSNADKFKSQLGVIARDEKKVPLTYERWTDVPKAIKIDIWKEVKDNTNVPEEYKVSCLQEVCSRWRDWKCRVKKNWYSSWSNDSDRLANPPPFVAVDQWKTLVSYWGLRKVQERAQKNCDSRKQAEMLSRTGRTLYAIVRDKMKKKGEDVNCMTMFMKTRKKKNGSIGDEDKGSVKLLSNE